jgi:hypothetical protein
MATLLSALNASYSEDASILTGNPNRVTVEVEDDEDARFWRNLLETIRPDKDFHFDPYKTLTPAHQKDKQGKGKAEILKDANSFNAFHIGCVDSDYDWLLSDSTEAGKTMATNNYLLQTYSYSIENLLCLATTLQEYCKDLTDEETNFDFCNYLLQLSHIVYPLLLWSVYLYGKGNHDFTPTDWRGILVNTLQEAEPSLTQIRQKAEERLSAIEQSHSSEEAEKRKRQNIFQQKGVTPENAYLYVRGHDLYDHLLNSLLRPMVKALSNKHFQRLSGDEHAKYLSKAKKESLYSNYRYKHNTELYDRIVQDISQIWPNGPFI